MYELRAYHVAESVVEAFLDEVLRNHFLATAERQHQRIAISKLNTSHVTVVTKTAKVGNKNMYKNMQEKQTYVHCAKQMN